MHVLTSGYEGDLDDIGNVSVEQVVMRHNTLPMPPGAWNPINRSSPLIETGNGPHAKLTDLAP